jgi:hypothetical protein
MLLYSYYNNIYATARRCRPVKRINSSVYGSPRDPSADRVANAHKRIALYL